MLSTELRLFPEPPSIFSQSSRYSHDSHVAVCPPGRVHRAVCRTGQRKVCTVVSALVLLGAVTFTLVAAYQWVGRLGLLNAGRDGQTRAWSTALAIILWLVWFFGTVAPT